MLSDRLNSEGVPCKIMSFPRYETPTGNIIKRYLGRDGYAQEFGEATRLDPKVASVFYAQDRLAAKPYIEKIIKSGKNFILDRYVESNMAHQGGKLPDREREGFFTWLNELEYGTFQLPKPDMVIFLYMPHKAGMELKKGRPGEADGHESSIDHLRNTEKTYLQLAKMFRWKKINCTQGETIDTLRTREDISEEVYKEAKKILGK
jgi:dTMP kinase